MSSRRRDLQNQRTSSFHIPMDAADKAGYGGEVPDLPSDLPVMPKTTLVQELKEENKVLQKEIEDLRTQQQRELDELQAQRQKELDDLRQQLQSQTSALSIHEGTLMVHDFQFTPKGLIPPQNMDRKSWRQVGELLFKLEGSLQWLIGDWLAFGIDRKYGELGKFAEMTGKDEKTLSNYMTVARAIEMSRRRDGLTFGHHEAVTKLDIEEQDQALAYALENGMSVAQFRKVIRDRETIEVEQISEYEATPVQHLDNTAQQYSVDISRFSPAKPELFSRLQVNDRIEIARRAEWLADYYTSLARAARKNTRQKK